MPIVELTPGHCDALLRFFEGLPEGDRTLIKEDVTDPSTVQAWAAGGDQVRRWLSMDGDDVCGYVALYRLPGWSDHVGEIRLVVAPGKRGGGLGHELARHAVVQGLDAGLTKLVVEVVAEQGAALALFTALGFSGEALLRDHIRDRSGQLRDLMVLAHQVGETWSGMATVGVAEELGEPEA
jgi:ribosomal protein S18 acetylase RimI-like enzyme